MLERHVGEIQEYAFIAQRKEITYQELGLEKAVKQLQSIFSDCIAKHEEGLVLKASDSSYADWHRPWIKVRGLCITEVITIDS